MTTKFIASQYGRPSIYKVTVAKETKKTLLIEGKPVRILGRLYLSTRINKNSYNIFDTHSEALRWLISESNQRISRLLTDLENVRQTASYLEKLLYEVESQPAAPGAAVEEAAG